MQIQKLNKIIHIDMDCFYAAIEMRNKPELVDKPLAIGGSVAQRGVLSTCNYPARKYGLHSAMSTAQALKLCPQLTLLPVDMPTYKKVSAQIHKILYDYTDIIEPLSLDEAYLDVTNSTLCKSSATLIALEIKQRIYQELNLTASAGIAPLKFLAKIASDYNKPNGIFTIKPTEVEAFIANLSLDKLPGVGKVMSEKLKQLQLYSCKDIQVYNHVELIQQFGKIGQAIWLYSHAIDHRPVVANRQAKSIGVEETLLQDIDSVTEAEMILQQLYTKLLTRITVRNIILPQYKCKLGIKLKFDDFTLTSFERTMPIFTYAQYQKILNEIWLRKQQRKIRLIGIYFILPTANPHQQLSLF